MTAIFVRLFCVCFLFPAITASAALRYVDITSGNPTAPYTDWATAATNIQDAVAAAQAGDTVLVTNGVYDTGGAVVYGALTNRVALTNAILLLSVNGPLATSIVGGTQTRCVYVGSNAVLSGFTVTNGHARNSGDTIKEQNGGGIWCEISAVVTNCIVISNSSPGLSVGGGGGVYGGTLYDSFLSGNSANSGGGARSSTLWNCSLAGNTAPNMGKGAGASGCAVYNCVLNNNVGMDYSEGGGAFQCVLSNCLVVGNRMTNPGGSLSGYGGGTYLGTNYSCIITGNVCGLFGGSGGGTYQSVNYNCVIKGNTAYAMGGGTVEGTHYNCLITENQAQGGGGAYFGTLYGCVLSSNTVTGTGGGAYQATLYNCTLAGNTAGTSGGGSVGATLRNCIAYFNSAPAGSNWSGGDLRSCCTVPMALLSITNDPLFVDYLAGDLHLQSNSPCINSSSSAFGPGVAVDLDGNPRNVAGLVDFGAYEFQTPASILPYWWLMQFGLPIDGSADYADNDGDRMNGWEEWRAGTIPTNAMSVLRMLSLSNSASGVVLKWQCVIGKQYSLERSANLAAPSAFISITNNLSGGSGATGADNTNSCTDVTATNGSPYFYRIRVQ